MNRVALTRALGYTPRNSITRASFVQLELAGRIGLTEGRYLVREDDAERVLIVQELDAPRPQRRGRRRARPVAPEEPEQVPVTRVTVTGVGLDDPAAGSAWLRRRSATASEAPRSFAMRPGSSTAPSAHCAPRRAIPWSRRSA